MPSGIAVSGATVSSDKRLACIDIPLISALTVKGKLETVEYDQPYNLEDQYITDTPQSHHCGFIAQAVQQTEELNASLIGGEIDEDGKQLIRCSKYNVALTFSI